MGSTVTFPSMHVSYFNHTHLHYYPLSSYPPSLLLPAPFSFPRSSSSTFGLFLFTYFYSHIREKIYITHLSVSCLFSLTWWPVIISIFQQVTLFHSFLWLNSIPLWVCVYVYTYVHIYAHTCIYVHIYMHICTFIYTYTHIY